YGVRDAAAEVGRARAESGTPAGRAGRWAPPAGRHRDLSPHPVRGAARARLYQCRPLSARALVDGAPGAPHRPHAPGLHALWRRAAGVSRTASGVARNQNGDGDARAQFYPHPTRGDAPTRGGFCLYPEADASQTPDPPARGRAADRGEPLTSRGGRRTHGACPTTAHARTAHPWPTQSTPWPPHHATDRRDAPHSVAPS